MYNSIDILEDITQPLPVNNINDNNLKNRNDNNLEGSLYNNTFDNSVRLRIIFDSLCRICNEYTKWNFDIELISYKNDKSEFLSNICKLQRYILSSINEEDRNDFVSNNYIVLELLCYYLLNILCEADILSITKNYSNKIISTIRTIPNYEDLVYSYIINLCIDNDYIKVYKYRKDRDIKIRFCNIYTILSQNLLIGLNKEKITHLLNSLIRLFLIDYRLDIGVDRNSTNSTSTKLINTFDLNNYINSFEGVKCINILLYNKLIEYYEINDILINRLLEYLLYVLINDSKDYRLLSSCSTCFIGILLFIIYKNDCYYILELIIRSYNEFDLIDLLDDDKILNLIDKVRTFPKLNYIYTIRSVLLYLHNCHSYGIKNVFIDDKLTNILLKCYEIIRLNLMNNNIYLINYSLMQTVQTYTIFLTHNYKDLSLDTTIIKEIVDKNCLKDDFDLSSNKFNENINNNKDRYIDSLIDLSNILINYFTNRIKTINHLSVYIYKKLVQSLSLMYKHKKSNDKCSYIDLNDKTIELNNNKQQLLINNVLESIKKNRYIKAKYILLDTIIKHIDVEKLMEDEPYLLIHLLVNINNNKSTITSLLVNLLTQIQLYFKSLCVENLLNLHQISNLDISLSKNLTYKEIYKELGQTVFKCYLYPILICMINDYKIVNDGVLLVDNPCKFPQVSNLDGCLMPINTDPILNDDEHDEVVMDRCNCIINILTNLIPNFTFELLKLSNEHYRFNYFDFLPQSYKTILSEKVLDLRNFYTNLRQFNDEVVRNIFNKDLISKFDSERNENTIEIPRNSDSGSDLDTHSSLDSRPIYIDPDQHSESKNHIINIDDKDSLMKILVNSKVVELKGIINYCESICLYNFRNMKKLNFVNIQLEDKSYNGLMICNELINNRKGTIVDEIRQSDSFMNEIYFIDIRRYIWNLYYNDSIEIMINLIKTICDSKKISKLITSNEFLLIKFILKDIIIFINISKQQYFIQLIQSFLQRLHYNFITSYTNYINKDFLSGSVTDIEAFISSNDNSFVDKNIGLSDCSNNDDSNSKNISLIWLYLVSNLKDIVEILGNNIEIWNNEHRILISLNIFISICEMFLMKDVFSKDLSDQLKIFDMVMIERLFKLFYSLKPINHGLLCRIFRFINVSLINTFVDQDLDELIKLLFHFNGNKYEMSSNIFALLLNTSDDIRVAFKFLDCIESYYTKQFNALSQNRLNKINNSYDIVKECGINGDISNLDHNNNLNNHFNKTNNAEKYDTKFNNTLIVLKRLYKILLDYYNNIDEYLIRNVSVSGVVNLISNVLKNIGDDSLIYEKDLKMIYKLLLDMIIHIISNYMSPNSESDEDMDGNGDQQVDCRGYYINNDLLRESDIEERSNVIIKNKSHHFNQFNQLNQSNQNNQHNESNQCNYFTNTHGEDICKNKDNLNGVYTYNPDKCMMNMSYDIINRNELKLFNYIVYKLVHELIKATENIIYIFTRYIDDIGVDCTNKELEGEDSLVDLLDGLIRTLIYCIINCRHVGCNDLFNNLLQFSMQKLLSIHDDGILYRYVYMLIKMIIYNPNSNRKSYKKQRNKINVNLKTKNRENKEIFEDNNDYLLLEKDKQLIRSNVIDINTRSEHLSLIFISIIKAEGSKKLSSLNNKIIFILIYILNTMEGFEYRCRSNDISNNLDKLDEEYDKGDNDQEFNKKEKIRESKEFKNDEEELINMINNCYINYNNLDHINYSKKPNDINKYDNYNNLIRSRSKMKQEYDYEVSEEDKNKQDEEEDLEDDDVLRKHEKNLISINVLNILRYIYRCIDIKYMNLENVVDVIKISLKYLDNKNWSVKNSSSLLLSTILSSLSNKPYFLNSLFSNRNDGYGILGIIKIVIDDNISDEYYYYTLYLLKVIIESVDVVCKEQILLDKDQLNGLKWLLVNNNYYLRKIAAIVLSRYYLHIGIEFKELLVIGNELLLHMDNNNYLNGYLLLIKHLVILTNDSTDSPSNYTIVSNNINSDSKNTNKQLLYLLYDIYRYVNNIENCLLALEIIKLIDYDYKVDNDLTNISNNINVGLILLDLVKHFDMFSLYRYYKCKLIGLSKLSYSKILDEELKNIENGSNKYMNDRANIYLIVKCIEKLTENNEIDIKMLNNIYKLICMFKNYIQLFNYYFISHNILLKQNLRFIHNKDHIKEDHVLRYKDFECISLLFSKEYIRVVKYCINNKLTSNNDIYVNMFKSLLNYFITIIYYNNLINQQNNSYDAKKDPIISIDLLTSFNYMLMNNNSSELDYSVRIKISNIYLEHFDLIIDIIKNINIVNVLNDYIVENEYRNGIFVDYFVQLLNNNLSLVFVNIMNLLHDDSCLVRYNIKKLIRFYIINDYNGLYNHSFDIDYFCNSTLVSYFSYELEFLNYIIKVFNNDINIIINIFHLILIHKLSGINHLNMINNKEDTKYEIYSKEETNIFKEDIILIKNILFIIKNLIFIDDNKDKITLFIYKLFNYLTTEYKDILNNFDIKSINKDKITMIYTYTLSELTKILQSNNESIH